jgi:type I restriction enzyme M protein
MSLSPKEQEKDILSYADKIWSTADILRGAGIKESLFPTYMMPFFALMLVESRIVKSLNDVKTENPNFTNDEIIAEVEDKELGYNKYIIENNKRLKDVCLNDNTFQQDFQDYLDAFDHETKELLGALKGDGEKFLDINGIKGSLSAKEKLFAFCQAWSEIDLSSYNNSAITTLEEHIKRRWADISAETAGEQYTPDDIIKLIALLGSEEMRHEDNHIKVYDMTCGGGNMLYGVEDEILEEKLKDNKDIKIETFGQELNDTLYALCKIESRFREDSSIECGNTLTNDRFSDEEFDLIVANPPYGVDWKDAKKDILSDQTGRFKHYPSTSDGQWLFIQHAIAKLNDNGRALIVLNGSPLFSGDAGSGESNARKWLLDNDHLEGLIQLPTNEFFNTGITTYLWILNKNKPSERKNKVILIDASEMFVKLKKSKGNKNCEINLDNRQRILETFKEFKETDNCKIFDRSEFYYNKQSINITNIDVNGKSLLDRPPTNNKGVKQKSIKLGKISNIEFEGKSLNGYIGVALFDELLTRNVSPDADDVMAKDSDGLLKLAKDRLNNALKQVNNKDIVVYSGDAVYYFDDDKETLIKEENGKIEELGKGLFDIKITHKKANKSNAGSVQIKVELKPDQEKDYEIIPFSFDETENEKNIQEFLNKWVERPYERLENKIGAEVNFNKIFYKPEELRPLKEIQDELWASHEKLTSLMKEVFNG